MDSLQQFQITLSCDEATLVEEVIHVPALWRDDVGNVEGMLPSEEQQRFTDQLEQLLGRKVPIAFTTPEKTNWVRQQQRNLPPVEVGQLFVYGPHHHVTVPNNKIGIKVDASGAFGSGHHPTTKMCLDLLQGHPPIQNGLDVGCGSGLLSYAMAHLWSVPIFACDHDAQAVTATKRFAPTNLTVVHSDGLHSPILKQVAPFDLIVANVNAHVLLSLASQFASVIAQNGTLLLSGILVEQTDEVLAAYRQFTVQKRCSSSGWETVLLQAR